jgi:hypothetical protein
MHLKDIGIGQSPLRIDFTRVSAEIAVESKGQVLSYWFDIPSDLSTAVSDTGNAWAVLMLPIACYYGEPLVVDRPLDRLLHDNLIGLRSLWSSWFPELTAVPIEAHTLVGVDRREVTIDPSRKIISSFSGGIDSLFSLLRHKDRVLGDGTGLVDDLLCVGGFNTSMADFDTIRAELDPFAERFGRRLVPILTNIRYGTNAIETPYSNALWVQHLAHGAFLAAIVHLLGRRYREFIIPASPPYGRLYRNWGSHPLSDPLLSSADLRIVHDGASFTRVERTELVARHDQALAILQVCGRNDRRDGNCSRCTKCLRTMATLDLLGAKTRAKTFDWSGYSMERLSHVWLQTTNHQNYFADIAERADRQGRPDLSAAMRASIAYSRRKGAIQNLVDSNPITRVAWRGLRTIRDTVKRRRVISPEAHRVRGAQVQ